MKYKRVRCGIFKFDIRKASYSRHLKSKKHLELIQQKKSLLLGKSQYKEM